MARRLTEFDTAIVIAVFVAAAVFGACSDADDTAIEWPAAPTSTSLETEATMPAVSAPRPTAPAISAPPGPTAPPVAPTKSMLLDLVEALAADELNGRDNLTAGSTSAQQIISDRLSTFADPLEGATGFRQPFDGGVNLLGVVPGTDLADEFVIVGAHYDHLAGDQCNNMTAEDQVCNGAADNATGVAVALAVGRALADTDTRRSVVIALWDAEEDGLLGSRHFINQPLVPLDDIVTYVNLDILGSNLLPSLTQRTVVIGAESGGSLLTGIVDEAFSDNELIAISLSVAFGQGRSDHAPFHDASVPILFFGDAANGCYHTVNDEPETIDVDKLTTQTRIITNVTRALADRDERPEFATAPAPITYDDASILLDLVRIAEPDVEQLDSTVDLDQLRGDLATVVDAGPTGFGPNEISSVIGAALGLIEALETGPCPS